MGAHSRSKLVLTLAVVLLGLILVEMAFAACDPDSLVQQGRDHLADHDIVNANQSFADALACDPDHTQANLFYSVTRVLVLLYETELNNLLDRFGVGPEGRDIYAWTARFPSKSPPDSPTSGEVIAFLQDTLLPEIEGALDENLASIDSSAEVILSAEEIVADEHLEVDYGDILLYKHSLNVIKAVILLLNGYHLDVDIDDILNAEDTVCDILHDKVIADPNLLTVSDGTRISGARDAIVQSINDYLEASNFIRSESDDQWDDFISIEPECLENERKYRLGLTQVRDSLEGLTGEDFTVDLYQFLDLSEFFTDPVNLRNLLFGSGVQDLLTNRILPQIEQALDNLSGVGEGFERILTPEQYPVDDDVEVDFGDVSLTRTGLNIAKALIKISAVYNMDVDLLDILCSIQNGEFCFNDLLVHHPDFLRVLSLAGLSDAKTDLNGGINSYVSASDFIRGEIDPQDDDLITFMDDIAQKGLLNFSTEDEGWFRDMVVGIQGSLSGQTTIPVDGPSDRGDTELDLTRFFDDPIDNDGDGLRYYMPTFDAECEIVADSFPDPTLHGVLPEWTQDDLTNLFHLPIEISGTVTCSAYTSGNIHIRAYNGPDPRYAEMISDNMISPLGAYTLSINAREPVWIMGFWDNDENGVLSPGDYCGSYGANPVNTKAGETLDIFNFDLNTQIIGISGNVSSEGASIKDVAIFVYSGKCRDGFLEWGITNGNGDYVVNFLPEAECYVWACPTCNGLNYLDEWWDSGEGATDCNQAVPVEATAGQTTGVDFFLGTDVYKGDLDQDGDVDGSDLAAFAEVYAVGNPLADLNNDTLVNTDDLAVFAADFGRTDS